MAPSVPSLDEVMQRMANSDPYHSNGINGGLDAVGERLMSLLCGMQLSPSAHVQEEDRGPCSDSNGMPTEDQAEDDIQSATSAVFSGSGHIGYPRDRLLAINASSMPSAATPPGLKSKLKLYPAMRPKRTTEIEEVKLPEVRKFRKKTKSLTQTGTTIELPVLPNGLAFTYDPVLGVWIPRSRPEDMKGV